MKASLIVMTPGPNQGRSIPIAGARFLIGRDQECNLRPASPAISKQHCGLYLRDGHVYVRDLGSTNGTQLDGVTVEGEVVVLPGSMLKVGPLEFRVEIVTPGKSDGTPMPQQLAGSVKAGKPKTETDSDSKTNAKPATTSTLTPARTPPPASASASETKSPSPAAAAKTTPVSTVKPTPVHSRPVPRVPDSAVNSEDEFDAAAMLLSLEDPLPGEGPPNIPEGSTVMDMPLITEEQIREAEEKKKKKSITGAEMSAAANDILRKYIRRTGN